MVAGTYPICRSRLRTSLPCLRLRLLARRTQAYTKAVEAVDADRRGVPAAARRPTNLGGAVPTAATDHAVRARCWTSRVRYDTTWVISIHILTPLPNIAMHIVQAPSIRFFAAHGWFFVASELPSQVQTSFTECSSSRFVTSDARQF